MATHQQPATGPSAETPEMQGGEGEGVLLPDRGQTKSENDKFIAQTRHLVSKTSSLTSAQPLDTHPEMDDLSPTTVDIADQMLAFSQHKFNPEAQMEESQGEGLNYFDSNDNLVDLPISSNHLSLLDTQIHYEPAIQFTPFTLKVPKENITPENIGQWYQHFIKAYHSFGSQNKHCQEKEHLLKYTTPPKYQKGTFTIYDIYTVAKLTNGLRYAQSWCEIARQLGFSTKGTNIAARVKDWVVYHHVSSFCDFLLGESNTFYMEDHNSTHHSFDPIPVRKRGRSKKIDSIGSKRIRAEGDDDNESIMDIDVYDDYEGTTDILNPLILDTSFTGEAKNMRNVDFTSDDALATPINASRVLASIQILSEAHDTQMETKECLNDAKNLILGLQKQLNRERRERTELHKIVDGVYKLCKSTIRR